MNSNRIEARRRIRSHIRTRGEHCDFEVTEQFVMFWWHRLNDAVFCGKLLPPEKLTIRNFHEGTLGWCQPFGRKSSGKVSLGIRRSIDDRHTFLTILAHEMVHQYQWQEDLRMTHGQTFEDWEGRVKRAVGLPLSEFVDIY